MAWTVEVVRPDGDFVIGADPWNRRPGVWGLTGWGVTIAWLERVWGRDHAWIVRVNTRENDPFGPAIYEESVSRRADVPAAIARVERRLHSRELS